MYPLPPYGPRKGQRMALKAWHIVGYTADADVWCPECAALVYDRRVNGVLRTVRDEREGFNAIDFEGNSVNPIFASDEGADEMVCNRCNQPIMEA